VVGLSQAAIHAVSKEGIMSTDSSAQSSAETDIASDDNEQEIFYVASAARRFFNCVLDSFFLIVLYIAVLFMIGAIIGIIQFVTGRKILSNEVPTIMEIILQITWLFWLVLYYFLQEYFMGWTLGKLITRTLVISADGNQPIAKQIIGRTLSRFIPCEPFSLLFGGSFPVGWHDHLSNTRVVNKP